MPARVCLYVRITKFIDNSELLTTFVIWLPNQNSAMIFFLSLRRLNNVCINLLSTNLLNLCFI